MTDTELAAAIAAAGGLVNSAGIAAEWQVTRQRVEALRTKDGFPAPVATIGVFPVWTANSVNAWRRKRLGVGP